MTRLAALTMIVALLPTGAVPAQDQQRISPEVLKQLRAACSADIKKLCDGVQPGGGRILQCMRSHQSEISTDCQTALANAKAAK